MHKRGTRIAAITLAGMIAVGALAGCSKSDTTTTKAASSTTVATNSDGKKVVTDLQPPGSVTTESTPLPKPSNKPGTTATTMTITQGGTSKEEYEKQLVAVTAQLKTNPKNLALLQDLAVAQYNTGRLEDATKTYLTMLSIKDDAVVHNNYANVLRDMNKATEAIQQYRRALALNPALTVAYTNLVAMYAKAGKASDALATLDAGIAKTTGADKQRLQAIKDKLTTPETTTTTK